MDPASGSVALAVMPTAVPAAASSAIWLAAELSSGGVSKTTGALTGPGGRYSMWSSGAPAAAPSKEAAVRVPVPVTMKAMSFSAAQPERSTISCTIAERSVVRWASPA
jgi:hypothetical protein